MKPFRIPFFALAISIALVFAFLLAGPVFAQDELPPAPPAEEPAAVETIPAVEEAAPVEEPLPAEEPPVAPVEEPLPVEDPAVEAVEEVVPPVEEPAVEAAPEIIALDEGGGVLPMASEEAAETVASGDPYFKDGAIYRGWSDTGICAAIVLPANCINTLNPLQDALSAYNISATATGPIYLEADTYTLTSNLVINPSTNPNYVDLTGLIGTGSGGVILNFNAGTQMIIRNMPAGFTLQGMTINGNITGGGAGDALVSFEGNTGNLTLTDLVIRNQNASGDGLDINGLTGSVTMSAVKSNQNGDEGAKIRGTVTGKVTVTNSSFDDNGAGGAGTNKRSLFIQSNGAISLNGVSASDFNRGDGAYLFSLGGITVKNSLFNSNTDSNGSDEYGYGLRIDSSSKGAILMDHVYANNNQWKGIRVDTSVGGAVTMTTVEATSNQQTGIEVNNCFDIGGLCTTTAGAVSLTNLTLDNQYGNLRVFANGAITLNSVIAEYAYGNEPVLSGFGGIILDNQYAKTASAVTVNNTTSNYNTVAGIKINSKGAVTLNHVTAEYNYYGTAEGIDITTSGAVTFLSTLGENTVYRSNSLGVTISAGGAVSISKLTSTSNDLTNLYIDNTAGSAGVTITTGDFSYSSGGSGLRIFSDGAITLTDVDATGNIQDGIYLENSTGTGAGVTIKKTGTNTNYVSGNQGDYGLYVHSKGAISVAGIYAANNDSLVHLDNAIFGFTAGITINGLTSDTVNDIGNVAAVRIYSNGVITASNLTSEYSPDQGFFIDNSSSSGTPGITLTGVTASYNNQGAMTLYSNGAVKITNLYAGYQTGGSGVEIHTSGSVTIDKTPTANTNRIRNNPGNGLAIYATGAVVLKDTNVYNNSGYGVYITGATTVSVTNSFFNTNSGGTGLEASASGAITLTNSSASNNGGYGVFLNNSSSGAGVTVTGSSTAGWVNFDTNASGNMRISTTGPLTLSYLQSSDSVDALSLPNTVGNVILKSADFYNWGGGDTVRINSTGTVSVTDVSTHSTSGSGLVIDNSFGVGKAVTITDFSDDSTTGVYALQVTSNGVVTLTDIDVDGGGLRDYGMWVNNSTGTRTGVIMKTSSYWTNNNFTHFQFEAIHILSSGQVTLDELYLDYNPLGLYVNTGGGVTVTDSDVQHHANGMQIIAGGAVTLTNNYARGGSGLGVSIDNSAAAPAAVVTITKLYVNDNDTGGLRIDSAGAVTITDLEAYGQDVSGYALDIETDGTVTINSAGGNYWEWNDLSGSSGTVSGGTIHAGGNVSLTGINAGDNTGGSGLTVVSDNGTVAIKNGRFSYNNLNGLTVTAKGAISLINVDAEYNTNGYGAFLDNLAGGTGGVTVTGATNDFNRFTYNDTIGLDINTAGAVTLNYMSADENPVGIRFPAPGNRVGNVSMNLVSVLNNSVLSTGYGFLFESNGTVTLSNIDVRYNLLGGIVIDNSFATTPKAVTLTNIYSYGSAGDYGLYVRSKGAITAKNIQVDGNSGRQYGIWLDNAETGATGGVTMTPASVDDRGYAYNFSNIGVNIESNGAVSVSGFYTYNTLSGVRIENRAGGTGTGGVTLNNVDSYNHDNEGVYIRTNGTTALSNMQVHNNGGALQNGIDIQVGVTPSGFSGTVTLTNITAYDNRHHEVIVVSHRQITVKNLNASDYTGTDTGSGAVFNTDGGGVSILDPALKDYDGNPIYNYMTGELSSLAIDASGDVVLQRVNGDGSDTGHGIQVISGGKVTLTNTVAQWNDLDGILVDAAGAISLTGVTVKYNYEYGAALVNDHVGSTGGVTITSSLFDNNYGSSPTTGLAVQTNGTVLFNQVSASNNSGDSALVVVTAPSTATVTINKSVFSGNNGLGLVVQSQGNITVNGITANDNTGTLANGVTLDNSAGTGTVTVLATLGANTFNENDQHGLAITSSNAVVINNATASGNWDGVGIGVDNTSAAAGLGKVTITGAIVKYNEMAGIAINSNGEVTLSSIECISNGTNFPGYAGIDISNTGGYNVLVQNSVVSGNGKEGIRANPGLGKTLTIKKTFYMGNGRYVLGTPNLVAVTGTLVIIP